MPGFISPQLATLKMKAPSGAQWIHEVKYDGYRIQFHIDGDDRKAFTRADSDEVAQAYRYEVARGFRDDVAHLSDLISPGGEAFWPVGSLALSEPRGQSGIAA